MKLIFAKGACSLSIHICLRELGLAHEAMRVSLEDKRVLDSYNPKSYVPALVLEDGTLLTEAISILQYLSEANGGVFMPYGSVDRAKVTGWLTFISSELHKGLAALFNRDTAGPEFLKLMEDRLHKRLDFLEHALTDQEFLWNEYTVADMYCLAILRIMEHVDVDLSQYRNISAYKKRLEERPVIAETIRDEEKAKLATELNPTPLFLQGNQNYPREKR